VLPWIAIALENTPHRLPVRVLSVGCGTCEEGEALMEALGGVGVMEMVGVDLDEAAIREAQRRFPTGRFFCADAAHLPLEWNNTFDLVLVRRPDLLAQPQRWRMVFDCLPTLLAPGGRLLLTLVGGSEVGIGRRWLVEAGLRLLREQALQTPGEAHLLVAEAFTPEPGRPPTAGASFQVWDDAVGPSCEAMTGRCFACEGRGDTDGLD